VQRLAANLRRVVGPEMSQPDFDDLLRRAMRSYLRYYLDAFRMPAQSVEQNRLGFRITRERLLVDSVAEGKGVVLALSHSGNWDAAGAWVAAMGWQICTVAERLKPESLYRRFVKFREGLGMEILPLTGGDRSIRMTLEARLRQGYVVPLLADRDLPGQGVEVEFFGATTTMPPGPALLALRTGAPLYVVDMWYDEIGPVAYLSGPLLAPGPEAGPLGKRVRQLTQLVADHFAASIVEHPEDWHMLQRMWPQDDAVSPG
jgi:KDO2-lipid IV(A) lauroyltransferase